MRASNAQGRAAQSDHDESAPEPHNECLAPLPPPGGLRDLLAAYQWFLNEASSKRRPVLRLPGAGSERFAADHVRRAVAELERRYAAATALSDRPLSQPSAACVRVQQFADSLPPAPSRWVLVGLAAAVLVLTRVVIALVDALVARSGTSVASAAAALSPRSDVLGNVTARPGADTAGPLVNAISKLSELSPGNVGDVVDTILHGSSLVTALVLAAFGAASFLILTPYATAARRVRALRHGATPRHRFRQSHSAARERPTVRERERAVFDDAGIAAPADSLVDLAWQVCLALPLAVAAIAAWIVFLDAPFLTHAGPTGVRGVVVLTHERSWIAAVAAVIAGTIAALWLAWLGACVVARRAGDSRTRILKGVRFAIAGVAALILVMGLLAVPDRRFPAVVVRADTIHAQELLGTRELAVRYVCDEEPCVLGRARLFVPTAHSDTPVLVRPLTISLIGNGGERQIVSAKERAQLSIEGVKLPRGPIHAMVMHLLPAQARQVRYGLRHGASPLYLEAVDRRGNGTAIFADLTLSDR